MKARTRSEVHQAPIPEAAKVLPGKTLENYDFATVPMIPNAKVSALSVVNGLFEKGGRTAGLQGFDRSS